MIVIDVGAHDGSFLAVPYAQNSHNVVYAIEPIAEFADRIRAHPLPNLHVFCMAMGNEAGTQIFHINSNKLTSSLLTARCEGEWQSYSEQLQEERSLEVPVVRLDTFMEQQGLLEVDLLKVDAQGYDLQVLQGAGAAIHRIKQIWVEVQLQPLYEGSATRDEVIAYLGDRGFRLTYSHTQTDGLEENLQFVRVHPYPLPHAESEFFEVDLPYIGQFLTPKGDLVGQLLEEGIFEGPEQAFCWLYLRPGDTFLDCGSHVGLFSCIAAQILDNAGRIVGIDPNPTCLEIYQQNLNRLGCTCFTPVHVGLSRTSGTASLFLGKPGMSAFSTFAQGAVSHKEIGDETVQVQQRSLDDLLQDLNIDQVTFAKLDVEGWEIAVLQGAEQSIRAGKFPLWMIEFTEDNARAAGTSTQELRQLIESFGYTLCRFDTAIFRLVPEPAQESYAYDNLFAVLDLDAVNQRLATVGLADLRIARDVVRRWEDATFAVDTRQKLYQTQHALELTQQELNNTLALLSQEKQLAQEFQRWAESAEARVMKEYNQRMELQGQFDRLQQELATVQQQFGHLQQRSVELRQHLTASRWLKLGRKLGMTKLDEVFPDLVESDGGRPVTVPAIAPLAPPAPPAGLSMEMTLHHLAEKGFQPQVVLDLGAAKGYWSEYAQFFFPETHFYMIDPLAESEAHLQELCQRSDRFHYLLCAVGEQAGQLLMNVTSDLDGSSLLSFNREPEPQDRVVQIRRVDDLLATGEVQSPQLVKMDLQGYELKALAGGQKLFETAEVFIMETSLFEFMPEQPLVHEVVAYMAKHGYVVFDVAGHLRRPYQNDLGQVDFVFIKHNSPLRASNRWG